MEDYIWQQQTMVAQYIATRSLLDLCEGSERAPGVQMGMWWWEQAGINLTGVREVLLVAEAVEKCWGEE